jgi:hypothetical protein
MKHYNHPHFSNSSAGVDCQINRLYARRGVAATLLVLNLVNVFYSPLSLIAAPQVLSGTVPPITANLQPIGNLDGAQQLNLVIGLPLHNQDGLDSLLQQLYDPGSTNFHQYLTPQQFTEQFGPTAQDYQALIAFAQANNLTVAYEHSNRVILDVSGTVADIESALNIHMLVYQHPTEPRTFYAPDVEPSFNLAVAILAIRGLNDYSLPQAGCRATPLGSSTEQIPSSGAGSGPGGTYWGWDFRDAYVPGVSLKGSNQVVGLFELSGYSNADIIYYETNLSPVLPHVPLTNVLLEGFNGYPIYSNNYALEATLDIDMAISMAPGLSQIIVYEAPPSVGYFDDIFNRMADDDLAKQLACCWYFAGPADPVAEAIFQQMAVQGQSMLILSGDYDAWPAKDVIWFPCDSPHATIVGGTELKTSGSEGSWESEAVWNFTFSAGCTNYAGIGSGGGISTQYEIPYWQSNVSMSLNQGSDSMRNIPDVALTGDEVFVYTNGKNLCVDGTSCATPLWAALTALVNQQAAANNEPPVGFLNPALYGIGQGSHYSSDFHDITVGNNTNSVSTNKFFAVAGYDLCTGWGTPSGSNLINDLALSGSCLFANSGALHTARSSETATLLPNGLVLVAGGMNSSGTSLASAELYNPSNGVWSTTGSLNTARAYHTATLLPDGFVLVAGGTNSGGYSAGAELYNPSNGVWTTTGSLHTGRAAHTAVLLPDGLVLVAGGAGSSGTNTGGALPPSSGGGGSTPLSSCELYSPSNGTWSVTGALNTARDYHTATLLPTGLVLAAGGFGVSDSALASAELYHPATGEWTNTGSLHTARAGHSATMLPTGLVLAAGGGTSDSTLASAELYNPARGTWTNTGSLNAAREWHTATLLPIGTVLAAGGSGSDTILSSGEQYDPTTGAWTWTCSLNTNRYLGAATLLPDGSVLAVGGLTGGGVTASSELYPAPSADTSFLYTGTLNPARADHTATLLPNGLVLAAGGLNGTLSISNADLFYPADTPDNGFWTNTGSLNTLRDDHTATLLPNESVLVAGGVHTETDEGIILASAELYSLSPGTWSYTGSLNTGREDHTATLLPNALVLVAGGFGSAPLASAELYNPATATWVYTGSLNTARYYHTATLLPNGLVLVAGGQNASGYAITNAELYNPSNGVWTTTGSLNTARYWHTATLLPTGLVLAAGGFGASSTILASAELYNPSNGVWTTTGSLDTARELHSATLLPTGLVVAAGGYGTNYLSTVELYNPAAGTWAYTGSLNLARYSHTANLLPSGFVLIAGGQCANGWTGSSEMFYP